ncbi:multiple sugar transport system permease protein [Pseudochelatococcus lubricantis]|uniref:Multiple sugar transport system permease protein n=1 Tax=Pseudochelatococcus lubricantis TaxID=1538102 RepID=A0ABX0VAA4_9HYPH|nr:multiple sugar transport system permease protein [Pseudochelatococcus lubricantis]
MTGLIFVAPAVIFMVLFVAYPIWEAIRLSFVAVDAFTGAERFVGLRNYAEILNAPKLWPVLTNTAVWTFWSLIGQFGLGLLAALAINRNMPGMGAIRSILLLPYVVPVIALALFWRWMLDGSFGIVAVSLQHLGLLVPDQSPLASPEGATWSVILANIWRGFPFVMISYWAALQSIPPEQYEAAQVDGATSWQQFRFVTLPNLWTVTKILFVLRFIWTITFFDIIWLVSKGGPAGATEHWPIWIYQETMGFFRFGYGSALAVTLGVMILVAIALYGLVLRVASGGRP